MTPNRGTSISLYQLSVLLAQPLSYGAIARQLHTSRQRVWQLHQQYYPDIQRPADPIPRVPKSGRVSFRRAVQVWLRRMGWRYCSHCKAVLCEQEFWGAATRCRSCDRCRARVRRALRKGRA